MIRCKECLLWHDEALSCSQANRAERIWLSKPGPNTPTAPEIARELHKPVTVRCAGCGARDAVIAFLKGRIDELEEMLIPRTNAQRQKSYRERHKARRHSEPS